MFATLLVAASIGHLSPIDLRVDYLTAPIGIDDPKPRLFWMDEGHGRNLSQSAYRIAVSSTSENLRTHKYDLWDSGKVSSSDCAQIVYSGTSLQPGQRAYWNVTVWDGAGAESPTSTSSYWELGLPEKSDWHAKWISVPNEPADPLSIPSPYLRKGFETKPDLVSARVYVTAKGLYHLFVDGKRVGDDQLTPGWTDYSKRVQYQTYDLTKSLTKGKHAVGLVLGNGWYCGHVGLTGGGNYGTYPEGIVQLDLTYKDGSHQEVVSDESWKSHSGAITSDDLLMGESEDARLEPKDWSKSSFDDSSWSAVQAKEAGDVPLVAQQSPTVRELQELKPIAMIPQKEAGVYVVDLGQNMVGWAKLKATGPAGTKIELRFAEMLNPDKTVYTTNLRGAKATDSFILKGSGVETLEPSFTTHGFRYVEIKGYPGVFRPESLVGIVAGSNNRVTGDFACSSELVNKLQHNIFWGERGNYLSIPTDCPQRDERLGWMGDAQIFVRTACYNNDVAGFMTKWTQDVVDAQSPEGGFSDVSPRKGDSSDGAPAWGDAGVIVPYTIYQCYGDTALLEARYPAMSKWIEYIDSANPDHLWVNRSNNNFGDWLNVNDDTPRAVIGTAYFAYSTSLMAKMARALGRTEDAEKYEALFMSIKKAFDDKFVGSDGKVEGDTQTDYVLALRFDLLPGELRPAAAKRLVDHIMIDRKGHLSTGFVGVGYLNPTLTSVGASDVAYKLLLNDTYPSWGYSIRQGATTIWERWDGWTQDKGFQDPGMNSFNHYSLGSVGEWMYKSVAGIDLDPVEPGYKKIVIHPVLGGGLTWAKAHLDSLYGRISSGWKLDGKLFTLDVTIPPNTTAKVFLPRGSSPALEGGKPAKNSLTTVSDSGVASEVYQVGSGDYHFEVALP